MNTRRVYPVDKCVHYYTLKLIKSFQQSQFVMCLNSVVAGWWREQNIKQGWINPDLSVVDSSCKLSV